MTTAQTAAAIIRHYNPALAAAYLAKPFNRRQYAEAFLAGFKGEAPRAAWSVLKAALAEQEQRRQAMNAEQILAS